MIYINRRKSCKFIDKADDASLLFSWAELIKIYFFVQDRKYFLHSFCICFSFQCTPDAMLCLQPICFGTEYGQFATERFQSSDLVTAQHSFFLISASNTRQKCSTSWLKVLFFFMMIIIKWNIKIVPTTLCRVVGTCYQSCYSLRLYPPL